jgi:predicted CopG family antitoxin
MPNIQVSPDTYRRIEDRAKPFEDSEPEDVIRRLLDKTESTNPKAFEEEGGADLVSKGGTIPHGSELRMNYKGREYHAVVDDGKIIWDGKAFSSPSEAAVAVIQSTGQDQTRANGWDYWKVKTPESGEWRLADEVREKPDVLREAQEALNKLSEEEVEELKRELGLTDEDRTEETLYLLFAATTEPDSYS